MAAAIERVSSAIDGRERIAIFGDYDADGITATAILTLALRSAATDADLISSRLPRRDEGYGLRADVIDEIANGGADLLIAVDCGSSDHDAVAHARARGLSVVILDHHKMRDAGPDGAIVASTRVVGNAASDYDDLTGAGLAYLLVVGLARHGYDVAPSGESESSYLDLVAIGSIADVASLAGINRPLVRAGLQRINERPRVGIERMLSRIGVELGQTTARSIAFKVAPRLNAAGRISDPSPALDLLLATNTVDADQLVSQIEQFNERRKVESRRIEELAEAQLAARPDLAESALLVCSGAGWPSGLLGVVASRLAERYGRPAIVLTDRDGVSSGSARSVQGIDITEALSVAGPIVERYGGHSQAAGLSISTANITSLTEHLGAWIGAKGVPVPVVPSIRLDAELPKRRLKLDAVTSLSELEPFGEGNPQPLFLIRDVAVRDYSTMGHDRSHLRITVDTGDGPVKVVMWGAAHRSRELLFQPRIDIAATIDADHWNGKARLHVEARDFRPAQTG
jgi:single-stranded-DNA-specific exonuclease